MNSPMTREELQELMPEYLAGELDAAARTTFEMSMGIHPELVAEVRSLSYAVNALRSLDESDSHVSRAASRSSAARFVFTALRYAAARGHALVDEREARQLTQSEKAERADHVIANDGSVEDLERALSALLDKLRGADNIAWSRALIDSSFVRAAYGARPPGPARCTGPSPAASTT